MREETLFVRSNVDKRGRVQGSHRIGLRSVYGGLFSAYPREAGEMPTSITMLELEQLWQCLQDSEAKQIRLQQLESLNLLHETAEEIQVVRKEINALHIREEIKWNQRSQVCWLQNGDKNTKFFHATISPRQRKNRFGGL